MKNKRTPDIRFAGFTEEWEQRKLGELIEISSASRVHKNEWTTSGVRFFRSSDVVSNFNGKKNIPAFISFSLYDELSKKSGLVQPGDILVTGGGSIGIPYLVADKEPLYFKDADLIWLKSANKVDGYFLYFYFLTPQLRKYISSITHIGTISHYTIEQAKDTPIILSERVEQTLVGNFFKQLDNTIALYQQEQTALKQTKLGFLQKMFPKEGDSVPEIRFPGFTGDWEQRKVMDFSEETFGGGTPKTSIKEYWNGEIPWIQSSDLDEHQVSGVFAKKKITEKGLQNSATKLIPKNSIAIVTRVGVGKIALMQFEYATSQDFLSLSNLKVNEWFGVYSLYNQLQKELNNVQGTSIKGITKSELLDKKINIPTNLEEQNKIGEFFKQLDDTIALHQRELDALKETKKAFLQKMFV
ncbi:restriction endonuclease subunit S [Bacillus cereus]|uniref:restriction endonuclease subunit S n=1 Tax=Bacillus cereus TaxID=1396 RepID=UPI003671853F